MKQSEIENYLETREFGRSLVCLGTTGSTNLDAKTAAVSGCPHGHAIVADEQTEGRGRLDHSWLSPMGVNIYVSIVIRPRTMPSCYPQIPVVCAIALHQALAGLAPELPVSLKWPNDLLTTESRRKLSGILCEGVTMNDRSLAVVAGIGINVNSSREDFTDDLLDKATSLKMATGRRWNRERLLSAFLNRLEPVFDEWQETMSLQPFMDYWTRHDLLAGRSVAIEQGIQIEEGVACGIDAEGRLILETNEGVKLVHAGDVHLKW